MFIGKIFYFICIKMTTYILPVLLSCAYCDENMKKVLNSFHGNNCEKWYWFFKHTIKLSAIFFIKQRLCIECCKYEYIITVYLYTHVCISSIFQSMQYCNIIVHWPFIDNQLTNDLIFFFKYGWIVLNYGCLKVNSISCNSILL